MTNPKTAELPVRLFKDAAAWEAWLARQHANSAGMWLRIAKAASNVTSVSYAEALDVALCYGWIDGQRKPLDGTHFLQKFTHRRPRSMWSRINTEKVERLVEAGRMTEAGLAEIEAAKRDGRWNAAYASWGSGAVPEDLRRALDARPAAMERFAQLDGRNRYAIVFRVETAKRPETRRTRIEKYVEMLAEGRTIYP